MTVQSELSIGFSEAAAKKAKVLIDEEANEALNLRVFVTGGGCSGFEYGFTFDEDLEDDDTAIVQQGVRLVHGTKRAHARTLNAGRSYA